MGACHSTPMEDAPLLNCEKDVHKPSVEKLRDDFYVSLQDFQKYIKGYFNMYNWLYPFKFEESCLLRCIPLDYSSLG